MKQTAPIMDTPTVNPPNTDSSLSQWLSYLGSIHVSAIDMGLERVIPVAKQLGILDNVSAPYIFMVAGTNGKGSTTATIAKICQQAGYKTALYQSPHLVSFNERIKMDGVEVADEQLIAAFMAVDQARLVCQLSLSFFEMTTLAALYIFYQSACNVWVLEVGLGGRLDVVNIIDADVCVITNVSIDHVDWLGDTREKIGFEKAGILRPNSTLIYGETDMPDSVRLAIDEKQVTCYQKGVHYQALKLDETWIYSASAITLHLPLPRLSLDNVATAISAVLASSLHITKDNIADGLKNLQLAGRFDWRVIDERTWLFDVAHNPAGVHFLLEQFVGWWANYQVQYPEAHLHLVFSMLADKDIEGVLFLLAKYQLDIKGVHIAAIDNVRALALEILTQKFACALPALPIASYPSLALATKGVISASAKMDGVLVFGSFHTISECLIALGQYQDFRRVS